MSSLCHLQKIWRKLQISICGPLRGKKCLRQEGYWGAALLVDIHFSDFIRNKAADIRIRKWMPWSVHFPDNSIILEGCVAGCLPHPLVRFYKAIYWSGKFYFSYFLKFLWGSFFHECELFSLPLYVFFVPSLVIFQSKPSFSLIIAFTLW